LSSIPESVAAPQREDEISTLDLAVALARHKGLVIGLPLLAAVVAAVISLNMTPKYTGVARLLPPQTSHSGAGSGMLSQFNALSGVSGLLAIKNPSEIYIAVLKSRTLADALIDRFDLRKLYGVSLRSDAQLVLSKESQITLGRDNLITIAVEDTDPKRAAAIANAYVKELDKLSGLIAVTEASQRRLFFEKQLVEARDNLVKAELDARSAMDEGGLAAVDAQGRTIIQTTEMLRARVASKEVELNSMRGFATEQNPAYRNALEELNALREQLAKMERGDGGSKTGRTAGQKNLMKLRELRYHEELLEFFSRQYERAKVEEARQGTVIQVLDWAVEPDRRSSPKRSLIVLLTTAIATIVAVALALILEALERARQDPRGSQRLADLRRHLWLRRR
jgi:uncharacterized protein involved in exopolysaccharide biosynthesis